MLSSLFRRRYDPAGYWGRRADPNACAPDPERVAFDRDFVASATRDASSVFELGPGTGRTLEAYRPGQLITTRDITDRHRLRIAGIAAERGLSVEQGFSSDPLASYPYPDCAFDIGVTVQVLLHMPPDAFRHAISELSRVSERLAIVSGYHATFPEEAGRHLPRHVFAHDYIAALCELGRVVTGAASRDGILYVTAR